MRRARVLVSVLAVLATSLLAGSAPGAARQGTPAPGVATVQNDRLLVEVALDAPPLAFVLLGFVTFEPGTRDRPHRSPGAVLQYVVSGTLTHEVDGPAAVYRAEPDATPGTGEAAAGAGGVEHVLGPGDAIFVPEGGVPRARRNDGTDPAVWLEVAFVPEEGAGSFAEPMGEADVVSAGFVPRPDLATLGSPIVVELRRVVLPPDGVLPPPPAGQIRQLATEPGPGGTVAQLSDGSARNIGPTPIVVYALTLAAAGDGTAVPRAGMPAPLATSWSGAHGSARDPGGYTVWVK